MGYLKTMNKTILNSAHVSIIKSLFLTSSLSISFLNAAGQTLQTVTDNGNTTTTRIISNPVGIPGSRITAYGSGSGYFDVYNNENNSISLFLRRSDGALAFGVDGHTMVSSFGGNVDAAGSISASSINAMSPSFSGTAIPVNIYSLAGLRINGTIANSSQNAITYQSGGGGGAAIGFYRGGSYDTGIDFFTNSNSTPSHGNISHRMRINANGDVAIGTTETQGYKLAVAGNIIGESITVKLHNNWPDYVFNSSHKKLSLSELESYIKVNHHLPEIPTTKEAEENGINIEEMNEMLLKEVEELTLYLIEKDKEIKEGKSTLIKQQEIIMKQQCRLDKIEYLINKLKK